MLDLVERYREEQVAALVERDTLVARFLGGCVLVGVGSQHVGVALHERAVGSKNLGNHLVTRVLDRLPATDVVETVVLECKLQATLGADGLLEGVAGRGDIVTTYTVAHLVECPLSLGVVAGLIASLGIEQQDVGIAQQTDVERDEVLAPLARTLLVGDVELAAHTCRLVNVGRDVVGTLHHVGVLVGLSGILVGNKFGKVILARNLGGTGLDDGPLQTLVVTFVDEGLLEVAGGKTPSPAIVDLRTVGADHRQGVAQGVGLVEDCLDLEERLLVVVGIDIPDIAEVLHQLILLRVDDLLENGCGLAPLLLIDQRLAKISEGSTLGGTSEFGGRVLAARRQHGSSIAEVLFDQSPDVGSRRTGNALDILRHHEVVDDRHATEVAHKVEIIVSAQELGFGNEASLLLGVLEVRIGDAVDGNVAREDSLITMHPVVVEGAVRLTDALIMCQGIVVALALLKVAHPHVIRAHVGHDPEVLNLPPAIECQGIVATVEVGSGLILGHEI